MEDSLFLRFDLMVQLPWSDLLENQFIKPLGPSLGVNQMWIKRNEHAPKNGRAEFFLNICPKRAVFKKKSLTILLSCLLLSCLHLLYPEKDFRSRFIIAIFLCHVHLPFSTRALVLPLTLQTDWTMSMDNVGPRICLLGTSNSMITLTFWPWCNPKWSRDEFNNQSWILQGLGATSRSMV